MPNVLPYNATVRDIKTLRPDGIIISNGPSQAKEVLPYLRQILDEYLGKLPILGVGLGFLAISAYLDLSLVDLPPVPERDQFPGDRAEQRTDLADGHEYWPAGFAG
jgi:carbamoyl-phosphate synthase small subunit